MKTLIMDPSPAGWAYGFPKVAPKGWKRWSKKKQEKWLIDQGYQADFLNIML